MTLDQINQTFHAENTCTLKETATQPVFGDGPSDARIVIIGEAPGANEDASGKPFIGRAGQILESFLSEAGLSRPDVYITNTVKYRPPKNRDPKPEEKEACLPWLSAELAAINPRIIVTLGQHALQTFDPNAKIGQAHGQIVKNQSEIAILSDAIIFPLYHPAATIYNPKLRETMSQDMKKLKKLL